MKVHWLPEPDEHDYPAAEEYLRLTMPDTMAHSVARQLREKCEMTQFKAKDIFRASGLSLLGISNSHVKKNIQKIEAKQPLSPILLVQDRGHLIIADGYHRLCAVYQVDEDAYIPCKIR